MQKQSQRARKFSNRTKSFLLQNDITVYQLGRVIKYTNFERLYTVIYEKNGAFHDSTIAKIEAFIEDYKEGKYKRTKTGQLRKPAL